jgi:hypothetical protein
MLKPITNGTLIERLERRILTLRLLADYGEIPSAQLTLLCIKAVPPLPRRTMNETSKEWCKKHSIKI